MNTISRAIPAIALAAPGTLASLFGLCWLYGTTPGVGADTWQPTISSISDPGQRGNELLADADGGAELRRNETLADADGGAELRRNETLAENGSGSELRRNDVARNEDGLPVRGHGKLA